MPALMWLYLTALLYSRTAATGVAMSEAWPTVSHDRLTRMLQADWSGPTRLESACRMLCVCERGYLLLDATVMPKPFATAMESLAWGFSSQERRPVDGCSLVLLVWTEGTRRLAWGIRLWRTGGPSTDGLALEWLSEARNRLHCRPGQVLFDAGQPSTALVQRIRDDGWSVGCRLKRHRRFNGQPLRAQRRHPDWAETGLWSGGLKVLGVRDGAKYVATNRLLRPAAEGRRLQRFRSQREAVIRVCKDQLRLSGCQARSEQAQVHPLTGCVIAFCVLERERHDRGLTIDTLRQQLSCQGRTLVLPALERLSRAA